VSVLTCLGCICAARCVNSRFRLAADMDFTKLRVLRPQDLTTTFITAGQLLRYFQLTAACAWTDFLEVLSSIHSFILLPLLFALNH
jgi:hypothetical protein